MMFIVGVGLMPGPMYFCATAACFTSHEPPATCNLPSRMHVLINLDIFHRNILHSGLFILRRLAQPLQQQLAATAKNGS